MRRTRARFGRLSVVPAAVGVGVVLLLGVVFFALCEWGIGVMWPRVSVNPPDTRIGSYLCVRRDGLPMRVLEVHTPAYRDALADRSIHELDKVLMDAWVVVRSEGAGDSSWSDFRLRTRLRLVPNPYARGASGLATTPDEEVALLRYLQKNHAKTLPAPLLGSAGLTVTEWIPEGLLHNGLVGGALVVALGAAVFGVWRVVRAERRFRAWVLTNCAYCGYSLEGLTIGRCPECGRVRMPRWR